MLSDFDSSQYWNEDNIIAVPKQQMILTPMKVAVEALSTEEAIKAV